MQTLRLGPLSAVMTSPKAGSSADGPALWVVLLHGFGAPARDLVSLTQALAPLPAVRFVYPGAPLSLGGGYGPDARAWWPIDFNDLDGARRRGDWDAVARSKPAGLSEARAALGEALEVLEREHGLRRERLVLGGFSQGAMLACDFALREASPLAGLVLLSGMPMALEEWIELMPARRGLPVFQSHSPDDVVLPFELAEALHAHLARAGLAADFVGFRGGHGIPLGVLGRLREFLMARSAQAID